MGASKDAAASGVNHFKINETDKFVKNGSVSVKKKNKMGVIFKQIKVTMTGNTPWYISYATF